MDFLISETAFFILPSAVLDLSQDQNEAIFLNFAINEFSSKLWDDIFTDIIFKMIKFQFLFKYKCVAKG